MGVIAGYYGGWLDPLVSRVTDIFFAHPAAARRHPVHGHLPQRRRTRPTCVVVGKVVLVLAIFGWPSIARLMRSSVLQVKPNDYVQAARASGASPWRIIRTHILPNALAPVIVVATINLGVYIAVEATLSLPRHRADAAGDLLGRRDLRRPASRCGRPRTSCCSPACS